MSIVIVVSFAPKPTRRRELVAAIDRAARLFHTEEGCERFTLSENPDRMVLVEQWADQRALDAHLRTDRLQLLFQEIGGMVTGRPEIATLESRPLGTAPQGRL